MKYILIISLLFSFGCASSPSSLTNETKKVQQDPDSICTEGSTRTMYTSPTAFGDFPCMQETQVCISGNWQGHQLYQTCESFTKSCDSHPHGSIKTGYLMPTTPRGIPCQQASNTCLNGSWVGPNIFSYCSELP